jgi:hypothetical protein
MKSCEFLQVIKSKNSLKRDDSEIYLQAQEISFKHHLSSFKPNLKISILTF